MRFFKSSRFFRELGRLYRNHKWELDDDSDLLIGGAVIRGRWEHEAPDGQGVVVTSNLITTEGVNYLLAAGIGNGAHHTKFFVAPFASNVSVSQSLTAAQFASSTGELTTQYLEPARVEFVESVPASRSLSNVANPAVFTAAAENVDIWGVGLLSTATKNSTAGVLLSVAKYATKRTLPEVGNTIGIKYTITIDNAP